MLFGVSGLLLLLLLTVAVAVVLHTSGSLFTFYSQVQVYELHTCTMCGLEAFSCSVFRPALLFYDMTVKTGPHTHTSAHTSSRA